MNHYGNIRKMLSEIKSEVEYTLPLYDSTVPSLKVNLNHLIGSTIKISFSGIITFKNAEDLRETVRKIPLENILIETDSPYLAPVPNRGKLNEPANVTYVAEKIAEIKKIPLEKVAAETTKNFSQLFKKCNLI